MTDFKAAIFDLDGTLLDSMWVWAKIDRDFFAKRGLAMPEDFLTYTAAMTMTATAQYTIKRFSLQASVTELITEWHDMLREEYRSRIGLKPHAGLYLRYLKEQGVLLSTATALSPELYTLVLQNNGIYDLFDAFTCCDEVLRGKDESADVYLLAAERLGVSPADCVVFEDVLSGVKALTAAGFRACGVYDKSSVQDQAAIQKTAWRYIRDFAELAPGGFSR